MLLVDDCQAEVFEIDILLDEGVGADNEIYGSAPYLLCQSVFLTLCEGARQEGRSDTEWFEVALTRQVVLLREYLRRRHHRRLIAVVDGSEGGNEGNDRLPRPHITLNEPVHRVG